MRCAVVFNGETQLNDDPDGFVEEVEAEADQDVKAPKLKHIIVTALKQEPTLLMDIQTLSFEAGEHTVTHQSWKGNFEKMSVF